MTLSTLCITAPTLPPLPTGVGDWLDSSFELQHGVLVQEVSLLWWDRCLTSAVLALNAVPPSTH
ncbi:MAG: hypothetical protein IPJ08_23825 [Burkholderiales bacterium]|nr:hypothetical protein [Burkholderiales bacterium]MBP6676451.1 hypothetical protein [Vitreoscilla sp.]